MSELTPVSNPEIAEQREVLELLIAATPNNGQIIREGEFCRSDAFVEQFGDEELVRLIKIYTDHDPAERPGLLAGECEASLMKYYRLKDVHCLHHAVATGSLIAYHVPLDAENLDRGTLLSVFARSLLCLWQVDRLEGKLLDDSIYYCRKAVELGPAQEQKRPLHLYDLGEQLTARYTHTHEAADYAEAEQCFQQASSLRPAGKPVFMFRWAKLIREHDEFHKLDKADMLRNYILKLKDAITSESKAFVRTEYRVSISNIWWHMGWAMWERWELTKNPQDLDHAIGVFGYARTAPQHGSMERFRACRDLGRVTALRFARDGKAEDGDSATEMLKEALRIVPDSALAMECLGNHLRVVAQRRNSEEMLTEAVDLLERAHQIAADSEMSSSLCEAKAQALTERFMWMGNVEDIDGAIRTLRNLVDQPCEDQGSQVRYLRKLANCLTLRFESLEKQDDVKAAQDTIERALSFTEVSSDLRGSCLHAQGKIYIACYKLGNDLEHINQAVETIKEALVTSADDAPESYLMHHDLSIAYHLKFKNSLLLADLSSSIEESDLALHALQQNVSASPEDAILMVTHGLANSLTAQFEVTQQREDIDRAILCYEKCVQGAPKKSQRYIMRAENLAFAYQLRFNLTGQMEDIRKSQTLLLEMLAWEDLKPNSLCNMHNNLGRAFLFAYIKYEEQTYLDFAIEHFRKALATGCTAPAFLVAASVNLTHVLRHKATQTKSTMDQMAVILQLAHSLKYMLSLKGNQRMHMEGMAVSFVEMILQGWEDSAFSATDHYGRLYLSASQSLLPNFQTIQGSAVVRFYIYAALAQHIVAQDPLAARDMISAAAAILPKAILLSFDRQDILNNLGNVVALPSFAIAYSLEAGDSPSQALELFDKVRSIMWDHILTSRSTLRGKAIERFPALHAKLEQLQKPLVKAKPTAATTSLSGGLDQLLIKQQHEVYRQTIEYQKIVHELQSDDTPDGLLNLPGDVNSINDLAKEGPIIIVNHGLFRSDAIIVRSTGVVSLRLPALDGNSFKQCESWYQDALTLMGTDLPAATERMDKLLEWLWDSVAEPIFQHIGLTGQQHPGEDLPRTWWITTGKFGMLPLHAAGSSNKGPGHSVFDRTIPSYINSLRALAYVRSRRRSGQQENRARSHTRSLLVSMETTPSMGENANLPSAGREVKQIHEILEGRGAKAKLLGSPTRDAYLGKTDYAHFACHGVCDGEDPVRSALRLTDWETKPLDVRSLVQQTDIGCQLAYLSACESASNQSKFRDEGLHLAGGFQMAGVPYVVATLWRVDDILSVDMAVGFYKALGSMGVTWDPSQSAKALRRAVLDLKQSGVASVLWAAYIHSGP
ncbi:hypothetical protein N7470_007537 [Penicillium chermesinum]|nr:hypothetical protein N7470_007537 [Penicillium chermesinum]